MNEAAQELRQWITIDEEIELGQDKIMQFLLMGRGVSADLLQTMESVLSCHKKLPVKFSICVYFQKFVRFVNKRPNWRKIRRNIKNGRDSTKLVENAIKTSMVPVRQWKKKLQRYYGDDQLKKYGLRYIDMVCDGDSKAYEVWGCYGVYNDCTKFDEMDKKSQQYQSCVESDG